MWVFLYFFEGLNTNTKAAILVVLSMTMISSNDAIVKICIESFAAGQLLFIRGVFASVIFMLIIRLSGRPLLSGNVLNKWNLMRALCECLASFCFVISLEKLPIAIASTLVWTSPVILTVCSAVFLGEKVSRSRWFAVLVGFVGVLLITNPFAGEFDWEMILPLMSAGFVALRDMMTRKIESEIHSVYVVLVTLMAVALAGGLVSPLDWHPVTIDQAGWLLLSACLLSLGFFNQINAVRMGEISFIAPFLFTGILVASFWGYIIWNEIPSFPMLGGIGLIIGSGFYVLAGQRMTRCKLRTMRPH